MITEEFKRIILRMFGDKMFTGMRFVNGAANKKMLKTLHSTKLKK